jgi:hypothetical protein
MAVIQTGLGGRGLTRSPLPAVTIGNNRRRVCGVMGLRGLGWAGEGATQANCPSGQWNSNLQVCCAPGDGTVPAEADPCSILNNPGFIAAQNTAVAADVSNLEQNEAPGNENAMLLANINAGLVVPNNIAQDAGVCQYSPGATFTDQAGVEITCPSGSVEQAAGIYVSQYSLQDLTTMLNSQFGKASPQTTGNLPQNTAVANVLAASAPVVVPVTQAPQSNALSNSAAQTNNSGGPSQSQISNASNVTGNSSNGQGGAAPASDVTVGGVDITAWIEQNWVLLAAGAAALFILPGLMKGGR